MRDGWRTVRLGELFERTKVRLGAHQVEPPVLSLSKYDGVIPASEYFDRRIASASLDDYKVLPPGDWAYSTIHIDEGSIGRNNLAVPGVLSPMYTTMRWVSPSNDPRFFELILRSPSTLSAYRVNAQGTVNRRRSLAFDAFSRIELDVPPLTEQRRIVDLIGALDEALEAVGGARRALGVTRQAVAADMLNVMGARRVALKHIACPKGLIGGPFGSSLVSKDYTATGVPVIRGANLSNGSRFIGGEFVYVSPAKAASLSRNLAGPGDIIATQRGTLGQVALVPPQPDRTYVVSQSQMRLRVDPRSALAAYVYVALSTDAVRDEIQSRKIATANPHINLGVFGAIEIPLPDLDTQARVAGAVLAIEDAQAATAREEGGIHALRAAMLADLLSGNHEIPESYDRFLDGAA